jgi:hypothetical protein
LFQAYGYSTQGFHVFVATDLEPGPDERSAEEQDLITRHVSFQEFDRMVMEGQVKDASTIAAYALYGLHSREPDRETNRDEGPPSESTQEV